MALLLSLGSFVVPVGRSGSTSTYRLTTSTTACPPETSTCTGPVAFPCASCTVVAGPVTNLGQDQAVYVQVSGFPTGDQVALAFCSLGSNSPSSPTAYPDCASSIPPTAACLQTGASCPYTASPLGWEYATIEASQVVLSIGTELDAPNSGGNPIVTQNANQYTTSSNGSMWCDNSPDQCAIEVMDIPAADAGDVVGNGFPPRTAFMSSSSNTVVIPLTWASTSNGCGSAPVMEVDTTYSAQQLIPAAAESTCAGTGGVAALATSLASVDDPACTTGTGTTCPVEDVLSGTVPVTFTDDPEDPATEAELQAATAAAKKAADKAARKGSAEPAYGFAYIPIAVSATELAFTGTAGVDVSGSTSIIPVQSYQLTPAMAAGIMTQLWNDPIAQLFNPNDDVCFDAPDSKCREGMQTVGEKVVVASNSGKKKTDELLEFNFPSTDNFAKEKPPTSPLNYSGQTTFALLNPWLATLGGHTVNESKLGAMFPSTASGASYEVTNWMCTAPRTSFPVQFPAVSAAVTVRDIMTSQQILTDAEKGPLEAHKSSTGQYVANSVVTQSFLFPSQECQTVSRLPTDFAATTTAGLYEPSSSPLLAAHAMLGATSSYGGNGGVAFSAMDSSQADYYGLLPASLQNAAGQFVAPSQASVDAALNDAKTNADGTLSPNFKTTDAAAYPLPMVTYALVSAAPQPSASTAQELTDLLTNLVQYSYAAGQGYSVPMPPGYFPLPQSLYQQALTDIAKDVVSPAGSSNVVGPSGTGSTTQTTRASSTATTATTTATTAATTTTTAVPSARRTTVTSAPLVPTSTVTAPPATVGRAAQTSTTVTATSSTTAPARPAIGNLVSPALPTVGRHGAVLPALLALGLAGLLGGGLLFASVAANRRRAVPPRGDRDGSEPDVTGL